jgi:hypothetical protein
MLMDRVMATTANGDTFSKDLDATREERHAQEIGCANFGPLDNDARKSRSAATSAGWVRRRTERPIYGGATATTKVFYDLCPHCAAL